MFLSWFLSIRIQSSNHVMSIVPVLICWFLRKSRNNSQFKDARFVAQGVIGQVETFLQQFGMASKFCLKHFHSD